MPAHSHDAFIGSFECTFCLQCSDNIYRFVSPNCSGNLVQRPTRSISA
nr:DUF1272 domain-containing protein [Colwellia sp. PAMC 21821]